MAWALWLLAPVLVTVLAAILIWWRGRPPGRQSTSQAIARHQAYLAELARHADSARVGNAEPD